jgi:hypothetical protein
MTSDIDRLCSDLESDTCLHAPDVRPYLEHDGNRWFSAPDWAPARLPEFRQPVLARARDIYLGDETSHWDDLETRVTPCVDRMISEIKTLLKPGNGV